MTLKHEEREISGMKNWNVAFALLFILCRSIESGLREKFDCMNPTIKESAGMPIVTNEHHHKGVVKDATRWNSDWNRKLYQLLGTSIGTVTDVDGNFSLKVPTGLPWKYPLSVIKM